MLSLSPHQLRHVTQQRNVSSPYHGMLKICPKTAGYSDTDSRHHGAACDPVSAFGERIECDLTHGKCTDITDLPGTKVSYDDDGALFSIAKDTDEPTVVTSRTLFFGRIDLVVKASPGKGIATSAVLQSATLDEVGTGFRGGKLGYNVEHVLTSTGCRRSLSDGLAEILTRCKPTTCTRGKRHLTPRAAITKCPILSS